MTRRWRIAISAFLALCLVSCDRRQAGNLRVLVGDGTLPAAIVGARETVIVDLSHATSGPTAGMEFILAPDNVLTARRYSMDRGIIPAGGRLPEITSGPSEKVQLSAYHAQRFRMRVGLYRPPQLNMDGPIVMPKGCSQIADGSSRAFIMFRNDKGYGGFNLEDGCNTASASKLEAELRNVLSALPRTKTAAGFDW